MAHGMSVQKMAREAALQVEGRGEKSCLWLPHRSGEESGVEPRKSPL